MCCIQALLDEAEQILQKWKHPDPYRPPTAPGGSKYERNLPCPNLDRKHQSALSSEESTDCGIAPPHMHL